jgi:hypothetical protein
MKARMWFPILILLVSGCAHSIAISPTLTPAAMVADKRDKTVGVIFAPDIAAYVESASPSSWAGSAHSYTITIGPAICACLLKSVEASYISVVCVEQPPSAGQFDRVLKFAMQNSSMDVYFQDGFLTSNAKSTYAVSVIMEAYDGATMTLLGRTSVSGSGFGSRATDAFSADKSFALTAENGVQQVCDGVANMLISGFAEPKPAQEQ